MRDVYRRELRVRPQRLASGGIESPEESSNGLRCRELTAACAPSVGERRRGRQSNLKLNCFLMRLLAKSTRARRRRPALRSAWSGFDDGGMPASAARRADNRLAGGGRAYRQILRWQQERKSAGSTNSGDRPRLIVEPPVEATRAFIAVGFCSIAQRSHSISALKAIALARAPFVSRGDKSGTNATELRL
jgi:hypothetical protein